MISRIEPKGAVYEVQNENGIGCKPILYRKLLLPCAYTAREPGRNVQLKPRRQRDAPAATTCQRSVPKEEYQLDSTAIPEDYHPTFSHTSWMESLDIPTAVA